MSLLSRRALLAGGAALAAASGARAARRPPNLLLLMTDQHHHRVLGCAGNPIVHTPHLDRLAAEGVRLSTAYCPTPYCTPTRGALLTGRPPHTLGLWDNIQGADGRSQDPRRLVEPQTTFFHPLAEAGYRCHWLGKWHLGNPRELRCFATPDADLDDPRARTGEARRGAAGDPGPRDGEEAVGDLFMTRHCAEVHRAWTQRTDRSQQDLSLIGRSKWPAAMQPEAALTEVAIDRLRAADGQPVALAWSVSPPHALWTAPAEFYDRYHPARFTLPASWDHRWPRWERTQANQLARALGEPGVREMLRCYYAQVTMMDACIGRLLTALDDLGLAERTLVVFCGDHGDMQGEHGLVDKSLGNFAEAIARVPLLLRLPGTIPAGVTRNQPVSLVDLPATMLDYLGAPAAVPGDSLRPLIDRGVDDGRAVFGERGNPTTPGAARLIRRGPWKLTLYGNGQAELYHLADDPDERRNLADDPAAAATRRELTATLLDHLTRHADPLAGRLLPT